MSLRDMLIHSVQLKCAVDGVDYVVNGESSAILFRLGINAHCQGCHVTLHLHSQEGCESINAEHTPAKWGLNYQTLITFTVVDTQSLGTSGTAPVF
jgi:hypothetical protein